MVLAIAGVALISPVLAQQAVQPIPHQATRVVVLPSPGVRFQQTVQQQQARDRVQQGQLEQQLRQGVSTNASRPTSTDAKAQQQLDQAAQAQANRDRADQQARIREYRQTPVLPRVVPMAMPPPAASVNRH